MDTLHRIQKEKRTYEAQQPSSAVNGSPSISGLSSNNTVQPQRHHHQTSRSLTSSPIGIPPTAVTTNSPTSYRLISPSLNPSDRPPSYQSPRTFVGRNNTPLLRPIHSNQGSPFFVLDPSDPQFRNLSSFTLPPPYEPDSPGSKLIFNRVLRMLKIRFLAIILVWAVVTCALGFVLPNLPPDARLNIGILCGSVISISLVIILMFFLQERLKLKTLYELNLIHDQMTSSQVFQLFQQYNQLVQSNRRNRQMMQLNTSVDTLPLYESEMNYINTLSCLNNNSNINMNNHQILANSAEGSDRQKFVSSISMEHRSSESNPCTTQQAISSTGLNAPINQERVPDT